jgi:hypothetical protein
MADVAVLLGLLSCRQEGISAMEVMEMVPLIKQVFGNMTWRMGPIPSATS